ncbi:MAG: S41 family peptidase, partial [Ignavibacterium sp.]
MLYRNIQFVILIIIISSVTFSQNYNDALRVSIPGLGSNARALGMGNSYISLSDDGSASFFNPAGLGLVKKLEFMGGIDITSFNNSTRFFNQTTESNSSQTKLDNISLTFPIPTLRGSLVFGLSYNTTKDFVGSLEFSGFNNGSNSKIQSLLDTDIPFDLYLTDDNGNTIINGRLNQSGNMLNSGSLNQWTLTGAIEAYKNLFIGANISVVSGSFTSDFDYYEDDTQNIYQGETAPGYPSTTDFRTFYLKNLLKWDIEGWNAKVGFLYQLPKFARLGLTVQFPKVYKINEDFNVEGKSEFANASVTLDTDKYSDKVKYDITSPYEIAGGISVNLKGLIIDLRNNPGGLLSSAVEVSDEFLENGTIVSIKGRNKANQMEFKAEPNPKDRKHKYPIVILINHGTASAAEIVTGALKDHKRSLVIGEKSFGKGSVQTVIPIEDNYAVRLTT